MNYDFRPGQTYTDENGREIPIVAVTDREVTIARADGSTITHMRYVFEKLAKRFRFRLTET